MLAKRERELFAEDPSRFLEREIKRYVAQSPKNRFVTFPGERIWDPPLVGFADGDAPLFADYKKIIGAFHLTPREAMEASLKAAGGGDEKGLGRVSVVSWVLPATFQTRLSMRRETEVCSLRWNHTRWQGQDLNFRLARYLIALIEGMGYHAVVPELEAYFERRVLPNGMTSNWSQRHIAYAAGLGTFSLSDGFITPRGIAIRAGSVVCDLPMEPTLIPYRSHYENCLFHREGTCGRCIERCPAGAISEKGHDKIKCREFLQKGQREALARLGRETGYVGRYLGCGLCQTRVPCESRIPPGTKATGVPR